MSSSSMNNVRDLGRTLIWLIAITLILIVAMAFVLSRQPSSAPAPWSCATYPMVSSQKGCQRAGSSA